MMSRAVGPIGIFASLVVLSLVGNATVAQEAASALAQPARVIVKADEVPAEEKLAATVDPGWEPPRTSWGDPELAGTWTSDDMYRVPRERPEEFAMRERLTPDEFAERAAAEADYRNQILNEAAWYSRSWSVRTFGFTSQIIDPPDGRLPATTEHAVPRRTQGSYSGGPYDGFEDFNLYDRCITRGISSILPSPARYGNGVLIAQSPDSVAISYEMIHETRIIKLDDSPHLSGDHRSYLGNSRGYWDGDTLVIETRNLTDETNIGSVHNSESLLITERLRRVDPDVIEYIGTFNDPQTFEAPFTYRLMLTAHPGYQVYEYSCHEGNTAVSTGLSGERAHERRVAEAVARGEPAPVHERTGALSALPEDEDAFFDINAGE